MYSVFIGIPDMILDPFVGVVVVVVLFVLWFAGQHVDHTVFN